MALHEKLGVGSDPGKFLADFVLGAAKSAMRSKTSASGTATYHNSDGSKTIVGPAIDGQNGTAPTIATHVGDKTPPGVPTGVTVSTASGVVTLTWDGTLDGGVPGDFDHVSAYCTVKGQTAQKPLGNLSRGGTITTTDLVSGTTYDVYVTAEDDACEADGTPAHNVSEPLGPVEVTVSDGADAVTQYVWHDDTGLHISQTGDHDLSGLNLLLTATKLAFRNIGSELMTVSANLIELGKNSVSSVIKMCGGMISIEARDALGTGKFYDAYISSNNGAYMLAGDAWIGVQKTNASGGSSPSAFIIDAENINFGSGNTFTTHRLIDTVTPTVLYNGGAALSYDTAPGSGTVGTVTLSASAAGFKKLKIYGVYSGVSTTSELVNPNGKTTTMQLFIPDAGPASMVYIKSSRLYVSGTYITCQSWAAMWLSASTNHFDATSAPEIYIVRVEGIV